MNKFILFILLFQYVTFSNELVEKVLYCETANASFEEKVLVASCIKNRVNHKAFKSPKNLLDVVKQPKQFSALNNTNKVWKEFDKRYSNDIVRKEYNNCKKALYNSPLVKDVVVYFDKSIKEPKYFKTNRYWNYILVKETTNFYFYKVTKK